MARVKRSASVVSAGRAAGLPGGVPGSVSNRVNVICGVYLRSSHSSFAVGSATAPPHYCPDLDGGGLMN